MEKIRKRQKSTASSCFVQGCRSGYPAANRRNKSLGKKNPSLFLVKNEEQVQKWSEVIQRSGKKLKIGDKVCELHFTEDKIIRYFESVLPDGTVWKIERGNIRLKEGAIPTIFPNLKNAEPCAINIQSTSQPNLQNGIPDSISSQQTQQHNFQNSSNKRKFSKTLNNAIGSENVNTYSRILPESTESMLNDDESQTAEIIETENYEQTRTVSNEFTKAFTYSTLIKILEHMPKPTRFWGFSVHDEFIMCANWDADPKKTLLKRVIIHSNLKIQVFLKNTAIDFDHVKICSIQQLCSILQEVEKYSICINASDVEKTGCDGYILSRTEGNRCRYCRLIGNCEIKASFLWLSKGKNFAKFQTVYDKIDALNTQINKIMKIKAIWKLSNQTNQTPATR